MSDDLTLKILVEMRGEIRDLHRRIDETSHGMEVGFANVDARLAGIDTRFAGMDARLVGMDARLVGMDARLVDMDVRHATRMTGLTAATRDLRDLLVGQADVRDRVTTCEIEIDQLKKARHA